jgi:hypothetical protein
VAVAWAAGVSLLGVRHERVIGILSEPGPEQRLTLIPDDVDRVAKVALYGSGDQAIARERANLTRLADSPWRGLGPEALSEPGSSTAERAVLVMERITGRHPRWDADVYGDLKAALTAGGRRDVSNALFHGDVTPWNTVQEDRGLRLLDWEFADLAVTAHCVCGLLDVLLRGAVVARAKPTRVRTVLHGVLDVAEVGSRPAAVVIDMYRSYRGQIRKLTTRPDQLSSQAAELLDRVMWKP